MMKFSAIFLALSFAATMFSYPGLIGTAVAQSDQGSESACGPGFTLQQGKCISNTPPTLKCPPEFPHLIDGKCYKEVAKVPFCPQGELVHTQQGLKCKIKDTDPTIKCPHGTYDKTIDKCVIILKNTPELLKACRDAGGEVVPINHHEFKCVFKPIKTCPNPNAHLIDGKCFIFKDPEFKCPDGAHNIGGKCYVQSPNPPILTCEKQPGTTLVDGKCVKKPGSNQGQQTPPGPGNP